MGELFSSGSTSSTQTSKPVLSDGQQKLFDDAAAIGSVTVGGARDPTTGHLDLSKFGNLVAGMTPDQIAAQGLTRTAATNGQYQQGMQTALGMTQAAAGAPNVSQFYNPYQQDVIDTTVAQLNKQTGQQGAALAAAQAGKKAFGSRADLATGQFMGNANNTLASTIAGLQSSGYNTALSAAQNQQKQLLSAGSQYGALTGQQQSGLLNTASALGQSGALQQQNQQAALDAPLTTAGRISAIAAGQPTGTATTSAQPSASPFSQLLGAGLTAASFFKDGGMADGGAPVDMAAWAHVPLADVKSMLDSMDPKDPNRDIIQSVYDAKSSGASSGDAVPDDMRLPTGPSSLLPAEQAGAQQFHALQAAQPKPTPKPVDPFLGAAPAFDMLPLGAPQTGGAGALSYTGIPNNPLSGPPVSGSFPLTVAATSDLMNAVTPDASAPRALGNGRSLRSVDVAPAAASNPVVSPQASALNPAPAATAGGGDPSTGTADTRGWLARHMDSAVDNPLFYMGLAMMGSKDPHVLGAIGEGASAGLSAYTGRQMQKAQMALAYKKNAQDVDFETQKLAIQQAVASGRMTYDQARLALAQSGQQRAMQALGKPSPTQERIAAIRAAGGTDADVLRYARGATEPVDDEDKRQKYALDYLQKNPGADPSDGYTAYDDAVAAGANTDDLKAAAGF